jgi:hypothetical protein
MYVLLYILFCSKFAAADHNNPIQMFWIDPNTQQKFDQGEIIYGERNTAWRTSFLGHVFELVDKVTQEPVGKGTYKVEFNSFYNIGYNDPPIVTEAEAAQQESRIEQTLIMEYDRSRIVNRIFTKTGFERRQLSKMDPYTWGSIQAYYYNNKVCVCVYIVCLCGVVYKYK